MAIQKDLSAQSLGRRIPWWDGWICAAVVLAGFLAARPYVGTGLIDDFSYVKTAWVFAATGHFVYNGWATAMLGWQILWAWPFIKVLGPTWFACRVSVTVLLVLSLVVIHAVLVRGGLNRERAAFGTLLVGLSPLTMPLAATFMTDVGGMLVILLALYCAMRAVRAGSDGAVWGWLALGFAVGALGGSSRQISWLASLVLMPSAGWLLRKRRGVVALTVVLWLAGFAFVLWCLHWFKHQPLNVPEPLKQGALTLRAPRELAGTMLGAGMALVLLMLPVLCEGLRPVPRLKAKSWLLLIVGMVVATFAIKVVTGHLFEQGWLPWTNDVLGSMDVFVVPGLWQLGAPPVTFDHAARVVGSFVVVAVLLVWVSNAASQRVSKSASQQVSALSWRELGVLLGPFFVTYWMLLVPRGIWELILDRYLLPLLFIAALVLLRLGQERIAARVRVLPWVALAVFALWSVAGLHDWIAYHRARVAGVDRVVAAGVPVADVSAGYEYDGMTQVDLAGAVYDPRVTYPAGFDTTLHFPPGLPVACQALYQPHTPALRPEYFLSFDQEPCLVPSRFGEVTFHRWLPPFTGRLYIMKLAY